MPDSLIDLAGLQVGAEDFLAAVLETAAQPIWVVDPEGVIRFANPAAIGALGYDSAEELFGRHSHETIHGRHPDGTPYPAAECPMLLPRAIGETVARDLDWFFRRDGSMFPVSYVSVPLEMPDGRGAVVAFTDIEHRLRAEQVLRDHDAVLAAQQAALRRVAVLVAGGAASAEVFAVIAKEVAHMLGLPLVQMWRYERDGTATVLGAWSDRPLPLQPRSRWPLDGPAISAQVKQTGRPVRVDDFAEIHGTIAEAARESGITSGAGAPIIVDGDVWGAMATCAWDHEPLPAHIEDRLAEFTELIAAAFSNTASQEELARLADEQAALRRVATLVARGVPPPDVFAAVAREVGRLLGVDSTHMGRYELDGTAIGVGSWSRVGDHIPVGTRVGPDGKTVSSMVFETGRPARLDSYDDDSGSVAHRLRRDLGIHSSVAAPVVVEGSLWGVMIASSKADEPLPVDTESRIAAFTELVATAIANTEARTEVRRLADEQAALRRVATLVAQGVPQSELCGAVTEEVGRLLDTDLAAMIHYDTADTLTAVAGWAAEGEQGGEVPLGRQWLLEGSSLGPVISRTGRAARIDDWDDMSGPIAAFVREQLGIGSSVGSPIVVEGRVWGALILHSRQRHALPPDTESRLVNFTELVATAMSNAQARAEVRRLADEQAALRRVATLVARESPPEEVFATVAEEVGRLLGVDDTKMLRYESDGTATVVADWVNGDPAIPVDTSLTLGGRNVGTLVFRTGRAARIDDSREATGAIGDYARDFGIRSVVGTPIVVEGRLWGAMIAAARQSGPLPPGAEARIGEFTELVATAISNIQARSDLAASRARIVAATDEERRRVVRDLHDGAQQRLVHTVATLKLASEALANGQEAGPALVAEALGNAEQATAELRELAHGILPAILTQGGLHAGVEALASRMPVPVENGVSVDRLPPAVEATAYFVVAEALTNVTKHARAAHAEVTARIADSMLEVVVRDDGIGGARSDGSGLLGLGDRLAALDGRLRIESPAGGGTLVAAAIPLPPVARVRAARAPG